MSLPPIVIDRPATFEAIRPHLTAAWWGAYTTDEPDACDVAAVDVADAIKSAYLNGSPDSVREAVNQVLAKHVALGFDDSEPHWRLDELIGHLFGLADTSGIGRFH